MFFNQPTFMQQIETGVSPQMNFQLPNLTVSLGGKIYPSAQVIQRQFFTAPLPPQQQPPQQTDWEIVAEILCALGLGVIIGGALVLTTVALVELLRPRRNNVPLTTKERRFIRERDSEICFYCGDYAPDGHVDHRVSRANNGGNEPENLTWACGFCNCSKGALNDTEYIALLESYC